MPPEVDYPIAIGLILWFHIVMLIATVSIVTVHASRSMVSRPWAGRCHSTVMMYFLSSANVIF